MPVIAESCGDNCGWPLARLQERASQIGIDTGCLRLTSDRRCFKPDDGGLLLMAKTAAPLSGVVFFQEYGPTRIRWDPDIGTERAFPGDAKRLGERVGATICHERSSI